MDAGLDYRIIFNKAANGMAITEFDSGRIVDVNEAWIRSTGIQRVQAVGRSALELGLWPDVSVREACLAELKQHGRMVDFETDLIMKSVETAHLISGEIVELPGKRCILWEFRDISEHKRMHEELRASEARLKEAQRMALIGNWELNLINNELIWSEEIYRIFEIDPVGSDKIYEAFLNAVHPDDREAVDQAYTISLENRSPYEIIHRLLFPDGRIKHVHERCETIYDDAGRPLRSFGTVQDITARHQTEEALQKSNERFFHLASSVPAYFAYVNADTLRKPCKASLNHFLPPSRLATEPALVYPLFMVSSSRMTALSKCTVSRARGRPLKFTCRDMQANRYWMLQSNL